MGGDFKSLGTSKLFLAASTAAEAAIGCSPGLLGRKKPDDAGEVQQFIRRYTPETYTHMRLQVGAGKTSWDSSKLKSMSKKIHEVNGARDGILRMRDSQSRRVRGAASL